MAGEDKDWLDDLLSNLKNIRVITAFDQHWHPLRMVEPHSHEYYQMDYFYEGHGVMVIGDSACSVRQGDLLVCNPGDTHKYQAAREKPMENIALKFELAGGSPVTFPNYIGNLGLLSRDHQRDLESHLVRACVESNKTADESLMLSTAFAGVFFVLLASYLREVNRIASSEMSDYCTAVTDYINRYYEHKITLDDLARIAGIHPKYLCHKFSSQMGMPPMRALLQVRMEAAKKLLKNTMLPVSEVAFQVGYMDIAHFSRRFKEFTGMPPKDYRKSASSLFHEYKTSRKLLNAEEAAADRKLL